jgi:YVTN family beta-propeller protein
VANRVSNDVTVIDGGNNTTATVPVGTQPQAVAVNPITNKIYVANASGGNLTVIDGSDNSTSTVTTGPLSRAVAVNPSTNKIYVVNGGGNNVTVIDGTNHSTTTVTAGSGPIAVAVSSVTNRVYVGNQFSDNVTVITPAPSSAIPLNTTTVAQNGNTTTFSNPTFRMTATSTYSPNAPPQQNIYYQMDTTNGPWSKATFLSSTSTTLTATAAPTGVSLGVHIIYFFSTDGSDSTSINPGISDRVELSGKKGFGNVVAPETSPVIGGINAYLFRRIVGPTAAGVSVSGRVLTAASVGLSNATVTMVDRTGTTRTARTSSFGYYRFDDVRSGETYVFGVISKRYQFEPRLVSVFDALTGFDFISEPARDGGAIESLCNSRFCPCESIVRRFFCR